MTRPRIVGIDYGRVRVGLAVADPLRVFAQPLGAYPPKEALRVLRALNDSDTIETAVIGWPYRLDGSDGDLVPFVAKFQNRLQGAIPKISIVRLDERFTSRMAEQSILASGAGRKKRRERGNVDAVAAAILLQSYLDA